MPSTLFLLVLQPPNKHFQPIARLGFWFLAKEKNATPWKTSNGEQVGINETQHTHPKRKCEGVPFIKKVPVCHSSGWGAENSRPPPKLRYNSPAKASKPWINWISPAFLFISFFFSLPVWRACESKFTQYLRLAWGEEMFWRKHFFSQKCKVTCEKNVSNFLPAIVKRSTFQPSLTVWWGEWLKSGRAASEK